MNLYPWGLAPELHFSRAQPILAEPFDGVQAGVVSMIFEADPRPLLADGASIGGYEDGEYYIGAGYLRQSLRHFARILEEFGLELDVDGKARCLLAASPPKTDPPTTETFENAVREVDQDRLSTLERVFQQATMRRSPKEEGLVARPMVDRLEALLRRDSGVHEVAGAWIFKADAVGGVAGSDSEDPADHHGFVNIGEHVPSLLVFDLQPREVYDSC